jgi:hypothetical protein
MTQSYDGGEHAPSPEELMAYADGELAPPRRDEVATWAASHPDAASEVEELRRLRALWQTAAFPEPSTDAWTRALSRVGMAFPRPLPSRSPAWRGPLWFAAAVAAVLPLLFFGRMLWVPAPSDEPFQVAEPHEVDIVSMDARDADALIGHPSLTADLEFTTRGDVHDVHIDGPPQDGWGGDLAEGAVLMVVPAAAKQAGN